MGLAQPKKKYTPQEYYRLEKTAEYKSDYYKGEIFAMAGGTIRHSRICTNISGELRQRFKNRPCEAFESNLRLLIQTTGMRCYPDVSVYCGEFEYDADDPGSETATNPTALFKVLSTSTEAYDRGLQSLSYRTIPSLQMYALVSQDTPRVEVHRRQADGTWAIEDLAGMSAVLSLASLGIQLPLSEVYDRVDFTPAPAEPPPGVQTSGTPR